MDAKCAQELLRYQVIFSFSFFFFWFDSKGVCTSLHAPRLMPPRSNQRQAIHTRTRGFKTLLVAWPSKVASHGAWIHDLCFMRLSWLVGIPHTFRFHCQINYGLDTSFCALVIVLTYCIIGWFGLIITSNWVYRNQSSSEKLITQ